MSRGTGLRQAPPGLYFVPFEPGLLIQPANRGRQSQEEQSEHEIGRRPEPFIQKMTEVKEQQRRDDDRESSGGEHQDVSVLVHLL